MKEEEFQKHYTDLKISYQHSARDVYDAADVIAIVTAWNEFKEVQHMGDKKIIDCRYMFSKIHRTQTSIDGGEGFGKTTDFDSCKTVL